ncbi:MAG: BPL-N domain-containing protein [Thermoplasmata archaeon]
MTSGRVVVYAGRGSSHSWTWLADLLEARGAFDAVFVDEGSIHEHIEEGASLVVVSGGDGFEIASALAPRGFAAIERFVRAGGLYIGVCAGAYLPLPSRVEPLDRFNLSTTRIRNLGEQGDFPVEESPRSGVSYGSCRIVHPVRGEVELGDGHRTFVAPVYGGPVFAEPEEDTVTLRYRSFTPRTLFQVDERVAKDMVLGAPALISARVGDGTMTLAGPHLEHPRYPAANEEFARITRLSPTRRAGAPRDRASGLDASVRKSLSDLKVAVLGMERESFLVGAKVWDAGRMLELANAVEKRSGSLDADTAQEISCLLDKAREDLLSAGPLRAAYSDSAPSRLVEAARLCVDRHFEAMRG